MRELQLNTVCEEAACPNIGECWKEKHATVMILGAVCTRACTFCNVATGRPDLLDPHEPERVGEAVAAARPRAHRRHLGRPRRSRRWRRRAFRAHHRGDPRRRARHDDRGAGPRFPAQGRARSKPSSRRGPTCSTTTSKPCRGFTPRCGRARAISTRCGCSTRSSGSIRRCSPNPGSWSGSARTRPRCCR